MKIKPIYNITGLTIVPLFLSIIFGWGCQNEKPVMQTHVPKKDQPQDTQAQIKTKASSLNMKAFTEEEKVTRLLQEMAKNHQAQLKGLEHRLKTKSSTLRKLKKVHNDAPQMPLDQIKLSDALRYTFEVADKPEGHYVKTIQTVLKDLETQGYKVAKVKNYWPKGDNYSGVNTVLSSASGLEWELQFHTPASYQESKVSHTKYEKLRSNDTPLVERQKIFGEMAQAWETIVIPKDILEAGNLHQVEEIKKWEAPAQ